MSCYWPAKERISHKLKTDMNQTLVQISEKAHKKITANVNAKLTDFIKRPVSCSFLSLFNDTSSFITLELNAKISITHVLGRIYKTH